jgi:hypothetical protein
MAQTLAGGGLACGAVIVVAAIASWANAPTPGHSLAAHTGIANQSRPYYAFWSGFGSDLTEFGVIDAVATATT